MSGNIFRSCLITTVSDNHIFGSWLVTLPSVRHVRQFTIDQGSRFQKRNKYDLLDKRYKCLKILCHIMLCCSKPGHICFGLFSKMRNFVFIKYCLELGLFQQQNIICVKQIFIHNGTSNINKITSNINKLT